MPEVEGMPWPGQNQSSETDFGGRDFWGKRKHRARSGGARDMIVQRVLSLSRSRGQGTAGQGDAGRQVTEVWTEQLWAMTGCQGFTVLDKSLSSVRVVYGQETRKGWDSHHGHWP